MLQSRTPCPTMQSHLMLGQDVCRLIHFHTTGYHGGCFGRWVWLGRFLIESDPPLQHSHLMNYWLRQCLPMPGLDLGHPTWSLEYNTALQDPAWGMALACLRVPTMRDCHIRYSYCAPCYSHDTSLEQSKTRNVWKRCWQMAGDSNLDEDSRSSSFCDSLCTMQTNNHTSIAGYTIPLYTLHHDYQVENKAYTILLQTLSSFMSVGSSALTSRQVGSATFIQDARHKSERPKTIKDGAFRKRWGSR